MVEVRYRGGFGDNLFQYCFARLLAERWGHALRALPLPHFPGTAEKVSGKRYLSPFLSWGGTAVEERQQGMLLRGENLTRPVPGRLVLFGWFQRWEYYRGHEEAIRRWLTTAPPEKPAEPDELGICIRTQRPESWEEPGIHAGHAPSWKRTVPNLSTLERLLDRVPHRKLVILTDTPHCPEVQGLMPRNPRILWADSFASWNWLRTCRRMMIPIVHPADWWAAFLSSAEEIYALDPWPGHRKSNCTGPYGCGWLNSRPLARPDLRIPEPRYHYEW